MQNEKRRRKCFLARAMKEDVLSGIARIATNIILKDLDAIQDYALLAGKDMLMNGLKDYQRR